LSTKKVTLLVATVPSPPTVILRRCTPPAAEGPSSESFDSHTPHPRLRIIVGKSNQAESGESSAHTSANLETSAVETRHRREGAVRGHGGGKEDIPSGRGFGQTTRVEERSNFLRQRRGRPPPLLVWRRILDGNPANRATGHPSSVPC
jgi:hypothetical protein